MNEQRNILLAIVFSVAILIGWQFYDAKRTPAPQAQATSQPATPAAAPGGVASPAQTSGAQVPGGPAVAAQPAALTRDQALAASPRIAVKTASVTGSIALVGARIDDLTLLNYRETTDPASPHVTLLSPAAVGHGAYYAEFGWVPADAKVAVPGQDTRWTASADTLTPESPVTLTWDNGQGLRFVRTYAVDKDYMFTVTQKVENTGSQAASLFPYALVSRWGTPETQDTYVLHEGPLGVFDGSLKDDIKYKKLKDDKLIEEQGKGGWIGFTDKYWLTAVVPSQDLAVKSRMSWRSVDNVDRYQTDWLGSETVVQPGQSVENTSHFFAGAKVLSLLDTYREALQVPLFDRAIDFGWFFFLTIPFFHFLRFIHENVPNFGIAILIFTVVIKGLFFPLANKSYKSMSKMKKLQPEVKKLQEKFGEDKARLNQEMMALYKREKANPVSGCLPILLQIPVFFALYKVLYVTIEMRQAPFYGWIHDLSAPDPTTLFNLFGLIPWTPPHFLHIGVWPLIMGVTMFLQQKLNPQPTDPVQAKMFTFLPLVFTFMLANFPAGLVIYWAWSNILSIGQQWLIMRQVEKPTHKAEKA